MMIQTLCFWYILGIFSFINSFKHPERYFSSKKLTLKSYDNKDILSNKFFHFFLPKHDSNYENKKPITYLLQKSLAILGGLFLFSLDPLHSSLQPANASPTSSSSFRSTSIPLSAFGLPSDLLPKPKKPVGGRTSPILSNKVVQMGLVNLYSDDFWYPPFLIGRWDTKLTFQGAEFTPKVPLEILAKDNNLPGFSHYSIFPFATIGQDIGGGGDEGDKVKEGIKIAAAADKPAVITSTSSSTENSSKDLAAASSITTAKAADQVDPRSMIMRYVQLDSHPREDHPYNLRQLLQNLSPKTIIDDCRYGFARGQFWWQNPANHWEITYHDEMGQGKVELITRKREIAVTSGIVETTEYFAQKHTRNDHLLSRKEQTSDFAINWKLAVPSLVSEEFQEMNKVAATPIVKGTLNIFVFFQPTNDLYKLLPGQAAGVYSYDVEMTRLGGSENKEQEKEMKDSMYPFVFQGDGKVELKDYFGY